MREPTHGERLYGGAVVNTLATLAGDATWKLQMILAVSSLIFIVRPQALGTDIGHLYYALCLSPQVIGPSAKNNCSKPFVFWNQLLCSNR